MQLADLPSRRTEAWKWSDLRAAMANQETTLIGTGAIGFGAVKLAVHRACIAQLFEAPDQVLDAEAIYAAREVAQAALAGRPMAPAEAERLAPREAEARRGPRHEAE